MSPRKELIKRIDKKRQELRDLELQMREATAYISAYEEALRLFPPECSEDKAILTEFRPGSDLYKVNELLRKFGRPLILSEILTAIGKEDSKANRASMAGSLGAHVRQNKVFTRPEQNTFGLIEFPKSEITEEIDFDGLAKEEEYEDDDPYKDE